MSRRAAVTPVGGNRDRRGSPTGGRAGGTVGQRPGCPIIRETGQWRIGFQRPSRSAAPISSDVLPKLFEAIGNDDARVDWDGEPFVPEDVPSDGPLELKAHEVAWGCFREIEALCIEHGIAFVRWSGGSSGSFKPERIVFTGSGDVTSHAVSGSGIFCHHCRRPAMMNGPARSLPS